MKLMKLSWRDVVNTLLLAGGGAILYARLQDFSWWLVGGSWRWTIAAMGVIGVAMCITSAGDMGNNSILNRLEMYLGMFAGVTLLFGIMTAWQWVGLTLASAIGLLWLVSTARHFRRSLLHIGETPRQTHHGVFAH